MPVKIKIKGRKSSLKKKPKNNNSSKNKFPTSASSMSRIPRPAQSKLATKETVCSITDPFCTVARSAKWPDGAGQASIPSQLRGHLAISTTTFGNGKIYITPNLVNGLFTTTPAASSFTTNSAYAATPGNDIIVPFASTYRIVTAGLIIRNVASAFTTSGYLIVNRIGEAPPVSTVVPSGQVLGIQSATHALKAGLEVPVIFRPVGATSRSFRDVIASTAVYPDAGFDWLSIEIVGAPNSTVILDIEFVYNVEFTLLNTSAGLAQLLPINAPSDMLAINVANKVAAKLGDLTHTSAKSFGNYAIDYIGKMIPDLAFSALSLL